MSLTNEKTSSDDEPRGLHWGWVVVASGFYCVTMEGGVGDKMSMMMMIITALWHLYQLEILTGILMESLKEELAPGNTAIISLAGGVQVLF